MLTDTSRQSGWRFLLLPAIGLALFASAIGTLSVSAQDDPTKEIPGILYFPNANSRPTYFTIHHVQEASRTMVFAGRESRHTADIAAAVRIVTKLQE